MRRKDREITEYNEIFAIMKSCDVCRVAFFNEDYPYIVPLNFGATLCDEKFVLYFHGAREGLKLDLLRKNNKVAFEMDGKHELRLGEIACDATMAYESVCGNGIMRILEESEKKDALITIMNQYDPGRDHQFKEQHLAAVTVMELVVNEVSGKRRA